MSEGNKQSRPKESARDHAHALARAGLSAIPVVGGPAAELFSWLIVPPLTKRRDEWIESIGEGLKDLEAKIDGFKIESLVGNDTFVSVVMQCSHAAIQTHEEEKVAALRNAVLNTAVGNSPDDDIQLQTFLSWAATMTPWHLRILRLCQNPEAYMASKDVTHLDVTKRRRHPGEDDPPMLFEAVFPELSGNRNFYVRIVFELTANGLLDPELETAFSPARIAQGGLFDKKTTEMGDLFLAFITKP
jgi:hypothetical protein